MKKVIRFLNLYYTFKFFMTLIMNNINWSEIYLIIQKRLNNSWLAITTKNSYKIAFGLIPTIELDLLGTKGDKVNPIKTRLNVVD